MTPFSLLRPPYSSPCRKSPATRTIVPRDPRHRVPCPGPKTTPYNPGVPAIQATFSSLLCFSSRVLPHIDYNITTYPSFKLVCHPTLFFYRDSPSFFFFSFFFRSNRRRCGGMCPLIYTCTSDHNINFNDGRDENIRTPRYLWRLSRLPSASSSSIRVSLLSFLLGYFLIGESTLYTYNRKSYS